MAKVVQFAPNILYVKNNAVAIMTNACSQMVLKTKGQKEHSQAKIILIDDHGIISELS